MADIHFGGIVVSAGLGNAALRNQELGVGKKPDKIAIRFVK